MMNAQSMYACYRRPDPETGQLYRKKPRPGEPLSLIGAIEHTRDPALFFHAEKFRGSKEGTRIAIMESDSLSAAQDLLALNPLDEGQQARWAQVRDRVLKCACWFATTQHTGRALGFSPDRFDGLDVLGAMRLVQERLKTPTRLQIAGSREMEARAAGYALIDWFVQNRDITTVGHGLPDSVDEVVSGNANGSDSIGEEWAMRAYIPVAHFPAAWEVGSHAGMVRNEEMGQVATHLLAFHLAHSKGTANMFDIFVREKKPYWRFTDKDVSRMKEILAERVAAIDQDMFKPSL